MRQEPKEVACYLWTPQTHLFDRYQSVVQASGGDVTPVWAVMRP
jgi:hypothetical protein